MCTRHVHPKAITLQTDQKLTLICLNSSRCIQISYAYRHLCFYGFGFGPPREHFVGYKQITNRIDLFVHFMADKGSVLSLLLCFVLFNIFFKAECMCVYSHCFIYWQIYSLRRVFCLSVPSAVTFLCSSLCYVFFFFFPPPSRLLGAEQNKPVSPALLLHYFHPCLRMERQFRIPEPSQTRSVLKRADATIPASPQIYTRITNPTPSHSDFGRTTGKSVSSYVAVLSCSFFPFYFKNVLVVLSVHAWLILHFRHFSNHVVETRHTEFCLLAV